MIGWLYGADFGDALCMTVNCGYDTDCTAATLGALLGILNGRAGLPDRWTAPLGEGISTNESWGGLRNVSSGPNPVPTTLGELTERVCTLGPRLLASHGAPVQIGDATDARGYDRSVLMAPREFTDWLWTADPTHLEHTLESLNVAIHYGDDPAIAPGIPKTFAVRLVNPHAEPLVLEATLAVPTAWTAEPAAQDLDVPARGSTTLRYTVRADDPGTIHNSNRAVLTLSPRLRPAEPAVPVILVGARRWLLWGPHKGEGDADVLLDRRFRPEEHVTGVSGPPEEIRAQGWHVAHSPDNALPDEIGTGWTGVLYARLFLWNPEAREVRLGMPATCPRRMWLNGRTIHEARQRGPLRPNYGGDHVSYVDVTLEQGWNEVMIKFARDDASPPFQAHFTLATSGLYHGLSDVEWTCFPWETNTA